jgi:hypothetical protein
MIEKFTFFWKNPIAQWHKAPFTIEGVTYNCAEQYMMAEKARLFGDHIAEYIIMDLKSPKMQQTVGRNVKGFKQDIWDTHKVAIVRRGNLAKFSQDKKLRDLLFESAGTTLVEVNPNDTVWGIGLSAEDPRSLNRETWRGENLLGEILTEIRIHLLGE